MEGVFTPIFVILMVSLLLECLSLLLYDFGMALCLRMIILMLLYLAYTIKRSMLANALKHKKRKLLKLHQYVVPCVCLVSTLFHLVMLIVVPFRLYSALIVLSTLPMALDEYQELQWLQRLQEEQQSVNEIELRQSLYYTCFTSIVSIITLRDRKNESVV